MTTILSLLNSPIGTRTGGFTKTIKTAKKRWANGDQHYQQVILMDESGEMLADVNITTKPILQRTQELRIIVCEVQSSDKGKKLYISEYELVTDIGEPPLELDGEARVVRSKIKCWLVPALIQSGISIEQIPSYKKHIDRVVDLIME